MSNLFDGIDPAAPAERLDDLLVRPGVRIERIVSTGQPSPPDHWYDQGWDEWVLLVAGAAVLEFASGRRQPLTPGDHLLIPTGTRHRVASTDPGRPTVWLAVHVEAR